MEAVAAAVQTANGTALAQIAALQVKGAGPLDRPTVKVLVVDDAHLGSTDTPARLRAIADSGVVVIATIPDDLLSDRRAGSQQRLYRPWADICDLAISLTWPNEQERAGEVELSLLKNRHGPIMDEVVVFQGHYARFCDIE